MLTKEKDDKMIPAIRLEKTYTLVGSKVTVLKDITIAVLKANFVFCGPSGAGKLPFSTSSVE